MAELGDVLARPKFAEWSADGRAAAYVAAFAAGSERHPDPADVIASVRDPADDYLVALAREAHADALVSLDRDLLDAGLTDIATEDRDEGPGAVGSVENRADADAAIHDIW